MASDWNTGGLCRGSVGSGSGRLVRLLLFGPYHPEIEPYFPRIGLLQESLRRNDIELRWEKCFPSRLRRIARLPSTPNELLILGSVPPVYQKLFLKQESAAMALGEVEPGSPLPFVAIDQAGAVRHATFGLIRRGLTRLVLVHADFATAGVRRAVSGFHLACNEWPNQRIVGQAVATGIDTVSLITNLRRIAEASGPRRGLIVLAPVPIGIVVTALLQHGIRMPHDAEVVALFHAREAVELHPPPVHYPIPIRAQTRLLTAAAVAYFRTGRLPPTRKMIAVEADKANRPAAMRTPFIATVTGEIPADQLGRTLAHEHLYCDISLQSGRPDNRIMDVPLLVDELRHFTQAGGQSIIEVTPEGIGRNPAKLRDISQGSGVQIVCGIAFYDEGTYPAWLRAADVGQIADYFVRQIEEGQDGVRAGLIGELASHNEPKPNQSGYRMHDPEHRVFVAAAQAQRRTGVSISTHASLGRAGHTQLNVLENAGADLTRVVIGHCDAHWHEDAELDLAHVLSADPRARRLLRVTT